MDTYNVFSRKETPAVRCAVRLDRPIPEFILSGVWEYAGTISEPDKARPAGFNLEAARDAARRPGYYLFHALNA
jgi:hypothetical protein